MTLKTFYTKHGDFLPVIFLAASCAALVIMTALNAARQIKAGRKTGAAAHQ